VAIPKKRPRATLAPITEDERWQQVRRCPHDNTLPTPVRAAGTLMLLYGLSVGRVATLRHDDPHTDTDQRVRLRYGDHRLRPPPAIATLVLAQRDQTGIVSAIGRSHPNGVRWLFPGGFPGRPAHDAPYGGLREHLHGHPRRARSAASASLAAELPAAVADWTAYLAAKPSTVEFSPPETR
jgi:hypothetical protein